MTIKLLSYSKMCINPNKLIFSKMRRTVQFPCKTVQHLHSSPESIDESASDYFKKQNIPPFVKNLFIGKFDKSLLSYAEVLNDPSFLHLEEKVTRISEFLLNNQTLVENIDKTSKIHPDLLTNLQNSGLFGMSVPSSSSGSGLLYTEIARIYEELGVSLALSDVICTNESLGVSALLKVTSWNNQMKDKYQDKISSGACQVAWCLSEKKCGSDPAAVAMEAKIADDSEHYILNGVKTWVSNAINSQLFLVFANTKLADDKSGITCFVVDRSQFSDNIRLSEPYKLGALRGVECCDVELVNCKIHKSAVLGNIGEGLEVIQSVSNQNKYLQTFAIVKYLRTLLNETIEHCNTREQFGQKLSEFSLIRVQLAKLASKLYSLESAAYFTAGLADASVDGDIEVESVITRQFASDVARKLISECLQLLGADVNKESSKYQTYVRDNVAIQNWQGNSNINKCFVAISSLLHVINHKPELTKLRQPANGNFVKSLKFQINHFKHEMNRVVMTHQLDKCFAVGLQSSARRLEWCAQKLPFVAEQLLVERGANLQVEEVHLARLHDLATEVFIMTCVLSRASRSLTLGLDNFEMEATMAVNLSFESKQRVKQLLMETVLCSVEESNRDEIAEHSADYILERGQYCAVHPLTKNSF